MVRPSVAGVSTKSGASAATTSPNKSSQQSNSGADHATTASTIREIRSRTISSSTATGNSNSSNARQQHLLATRRQAASMERLNGGASSVSTTNAASLSFSSTNNINNLGNGGDNNNIKDSSKCSPINGSSQSINAGSTASSPSRGSSASSTVGLNRTASRVSRFRSAKAVFERLSSSTHQTHIGSSGRPERSASSVTDRPRGTVASRYAAAAVARNIAAQQQQQQHQNALNASPRSRLTSGNKSSPVRTSLTSSPAKHHDTPTSTAANRQAASAAPRPQPRVIASSATTTAPRRTNMITANQASAASESPTKTRAAAQKSIAPTTAPLSQHSNNNHSTTMTATATTASKPPPRDLIDKIVLEIARDANKEHDANCTIQDLSNCDISGIPETLDFDKCFQDVEMMTEEEARKLLSRKSVSPASSSISGGGGGGGSSSSSGNSTLASDAQQHQQPMVSSSDDLEQQRHAETAQDIIQPLRSCKQSPSPLPTPATPTSQVKFSSSSDQEDQQHDTQRPAATERLDTPTSSQANDSLVPDTPPSSSASGSAAGRNSVRFSNEPEILPTWAPAEYDRRNDDIDPVAASAEYEIEKSRERDGIRDDDDDEKSEDDQEDCAGKSRDVEAVIEKFNSKLAASNQQVGRQTTTTVGDSQAATQTLRSALRSAAGRASPLGPNDAAAAAAGTHMATAHAARPHTNEAQAGRAPTATIGGGSYDTTRGGVENDDDDEENEDDWASYRRDYIESLEREVSLKRIFEQNLRDLQSQYYETVKQLDSFKGSAESHQGKLEAQLAELSQRYECSQSELADARDQSNRLEKQLNDNRESSQLLEKKYHRAKRIIKDMQSREESFTRREQLYQQKLDEIEYELGVLISTIDKTIYDDGLRYFSLLQAGGATVADSLVCTGQHRTRLDVFGLLKQMMDNFKQSQQPTQSEQIKQRIVSMLEQQLANLLALSNGGTSVVSAGPIVPIPPTGSASSDLTSATAATAVAHTDETVKQRTHAPANSYPYASHRLSQPNMPHPIGVGGQPTKIFHGLGPIAPAAATLPHHEHSPPQSVNSYPSTNSLNSLTANNNNQQTVNNNNLAIKMHEPSKAGETNLSSLVGGLQTTTTTTATAISASADENFNPATADAQLAQTYQSNDEWHNKPVSEWTTSQVSTWLLALGLDQYISRFEDRNVNGQSLINLDSTVLKGLGVLNSNDRNLLKKKIRELRVEMEKERKIIEKKLKENLKEKSKMQVPAVAGQTGSQKSWKKSLLS